MSSITAKVGQYGTVKGFANDNVAEFRGLPYAHVPLRWRRSVQVMKLPSQELDCTKYGPIAPQRRMGEAPEFNVFGPHYAVLQEQDKQRPMNEEGCLNLNIVTPRDAIGSNKKLPILLWIHGIHPQLYLTKVVDLRSGLEAMPCTTEQIWSRRV
jgi:carboxylesterase type B